MFHRICRVRRDLVGAVQRARLNLTATLYLGRMDKKRFAIGPDAQSSSTSPNKSGRSPVYQWARLVRAVERQGGIPTKEQIAEAQRTLAALEDWSEQMRTK